jgi:LacI family transcriptional regulator
MWAQHSDEGVCVGFDEREAAALVVDHLADLGHRQIGFIGGSTADNERARRRFRGVLEAVARRGLTLPDDALVETEYGFRPGFEAMQSVLMRKAPVSAVVCGNDYLAAGALSALDQAGIEVPRRMSVASFNDNEFAAFLHPPLTTVRVPIPAMGELAAHYLIARLAGQTPQAPPMLPVALVVRGSTAAALPSTSPKGTRP